MKELFLPYKESCELKNIGYNEQDLGYHRLSLKEEKEPFVETELQYFRERYDNHNFRLERYPSALNAICTAPLYQQAFEFFRKEYQLFGEIILYIPEEGDLDGCLTYVYSIGLIESYKKKPKVNPKYYPTYKEAELACIQHLIKMVKNEKI